MQLLFTKHCDSQLLFLKNHILEEVFHIDMKIHGALINYMIGVVESIHQVEKFLMKHTTNLKEIKYAQMVLFVSLSLALSIYIYLYIYMCVYLYFL